MELQKKIKRFFRSLRERMLLRLWGAIMLLVMVAVVLLWLLQIVLFEVNYVDATTTDLTQKALAIAAEINEKNEVFDQDKPENSLYYLSKLIAGKVYLVDQTGEVLFGYNRALITDQEEIRNDQEWLIQDHVQLVLDGNVYQEIENHDKIKTMVIVGVPVTYQGQPGAIFLYNSITEIEAMLELNRQQLMIFCITVTLIASLISFVLARNFTQPILVIKDTIERLKQGELTASPQIKRHDELGKLSDSVDDLAKELQRVEVLRKEVIANVSHELRAPLALITGYSEMVRDVTGIDEVVRNQNMDLIIREAHRLSEMVDDIMDYSQLQAGYAELKREVCNLYEIVETCVAYGKAAAAEYDIKLQFDSYSNEIPMELDALKITQVVRNLLNNAINHTKSGETIRVNISSKADGIRVEVINPGETISPEQCRLIWERYQRVQHQGKRREGTGIGLAIVSTILTAHEAAYGVESEDGISCFWFTFADQQKNE